MRDHIVSALMEVWEVGTQLMVYIHHILLQRVMKKGFTPQAAASLKLLCPRYNSVKKWVNRQCKSVKALLPFSMTNTGSGGSRADGCSHLGCHCEEGLPFWWRLTGYLLQDHGNSLICSPRVFPLQQWDQQRRGSGHFDNVEPLSRTTYSKVLTLWWWKDCEAPVWGNTTTRRTRTTSNWRHFPQDYGNEERVTAQCGRFQ